MSVASSVPPLEYVRLPSQAELREIVSELYACHHVLRSFGIPAESIFVFLADVSNAATPGFHVCVKIERGGRVVLFFLQRVEPEWEGPIHEAWLGFIAGEMKTMSENELGAWVDRSESRRRAADIARVLALKGLLGPLDPNVC